MTCETISQNFLYEKITQDEKKLFISSFTEQNSEVKSMRKRKHKYRRVKNEST